jgi:hypothetical protein
MARAGLDLVGMFLGSRLRRRRAATAARPTLGDER